MSGSKEEKGPANGNLGYSAGETAIYLCKGHEKSLLTGDGKKHTLCCARRTGDAGR